MNIRGKVEWKRVLRTPKLLNKRLSEEAKNEGVILNSFIQHLVSNALGFSDNKSHGMAIDLDVLYKGKIR